MSAAKQREQTKMPQPIPHPAKMVPRCRGGGFILVEEERLRVGAVDCGMATSRPTGAESEEAGVIYVADEKGAGCAGFLHLGMATQA